MPAARARSAMPAARPRARSRSAGARRPRRSSTSRIPFAAAASTVAVGVDRDGDPRVAVGHRAQPVGVDASRWRAAGRRRARRRPCRRSRGASRRRTPRCPIAAWRRASAVVLCAFTCGRSRAPGSAAAIVARLCSSAAASTTSAGVGEVVDLHPRRLCGRPAAGAAGAAGVEWGRAEHRRAADRPDPRRRGVRDLPRADGLYRAARLAAGHRGRPRGRRVGVVLDRRVDQRRAGGRAGAGRGARRRRRAAAGVQGRRGVAGRVLGAGRAGRTRGCWSRRGCCRASPRPRCSPAGWRCSVPPTPVGRGWPPPPGGARPSAPASRSARC